MQQSFLEEEETKRVSGGKKNSRDLQARVGGGGGEEGFQGSFWRERKFKKSYWEEEKFKRVPREKRNSRDSQERGEFKTVFGRRD